MLSSNIPPPPPSLPSLLPPYVLLIIIPMFKAKCVLIYIKLLILGMSNHLFKVHGISEKKETRMRCMPIQCVIKKKTTGEWLARQVCLGEKNVLMYKYSQIISPPHCYFLKDELKLLNLRWDDNEPTG